MSMLRRKLIFLFALFMGLAIIVIPVAVQASSPVISVRVPYNNAKATQGPHGKVLLTGFLDGARHGFSLTGESPEHAR